MRQRTNPNLRQLVDRAVTYPEDQWLTLHQLGTETTLYPSYQSLKAAFNGGLARAVRSVTKRHAVPDAAPVLWKLSDVVTAC